MNHQDMLPSCTQFDLISPKLGSRFPSSNSNQSSRYVVINSLDIIDGFIVSKNQSPRILLLKFSNTNHGKFLSWEVSNTSGHYSLALLKTASTISPNWAYRQHNILLLFKSFAQFDSTNYEQFRLSTNISCILAL